MSFRFAVKFSRKGMTRYLSHLDMQRTFSRALRRTGLSVKKSSGFNPHIVMSFASALSVGMQTIGDYMEFSLIEDCDTNVIYELLNSVLPQDIRILEVFKLSDCVKKLMSMVYSAEVEFKVSDTDKNEFIMAAVEFFKKKECFVDKRSKSGIKTVDIMQYIYMTEFSDNLKVKIALSNDASLNPLLLLDQILKCTDKKIPVDVIRRDLLTVDLISLSSMLV